MTGAWRVARREYRAYLSTPWCYGLAVAFLLLTGLIFFLVADGAREASLRFWFPNLAFINLVTIPVVTSRTLAEERRTRHLDVLLAGPVSPAGIVVGKWLAVQALFVTFLLPTLVYVGFLMAWGRPDLPPMATAYLGAVLNAGFFAAVGVMASAFTVAPIAAGVAGFAILVTLQLGSGLRGLGALSYVNHADAFTRGAPGLSDAVFLVTASAICLLVAAVWQTSRRVAFRPTRWLTSSAAVCGLAGANFLVVPHDPVVDVTATHAYTLSRAAKEALHNITGPATITSFEPANSGSAKDDQELLDRLRRIKGDNLQVRVIDIARYQGEGLRLGVTDNGQAAVQVGTRREVVSPVTELTLVSALERLAHKLPQTVCALTGHGERDLDSTAPDGYSVAKQAIQVNGIAIRTIDLTVRPVIPRDCTILALLGPKTRLRDSEIAAVREALHRNGKLIITVDPDGPDLDAITTDWGLRKLPGLARDPARSVAGDPTTLIVNNFPADSPLSRNVDGAVLLTAGGVTTAASEAHGLSVAPILATDGGWLSRDPNSNTYNPRQGDRGGPIVLGAAADYSTLSPTGETRIPSGGPKVNRTRLALFADADWAANGFIAEMGNQTLLVNTINWLAGEEDLVAVNGVDPDLRRLTLTPARRQTMGIVSVGVMPFLVLATGCLLWWRRRRG
jgi:ABC-type transport system involved in multi-copper enzyme maturation permease subunit